MVLLGTSPGANGNQDVNANAGEEAAGGERPRKKKKKKRRERCLSKMEILLQRKIEIG
jgi:hypothetical protein